MSIHADKHGWVAADLRSRTYEPKRSNRYAFVDWIGGLLIVGIVIAILAI